MAQAGVTSGADIWLRLWRLTVSVRDIQREHIPPTETSPRRGTAPSKTILFGKEHHPLPEHALHRATVPSEFHETILFDRLPAHPLD